MDNGNNFIEAVEQEKRVKVARLIVLLDRVEKELIVIKETLTKLEKSSNKEVIDKIQNKKEQVKRLQRKIQTSRLNLNYFFL